MARVTKSYVTRLPDTGVSAIASGLRHGAVHDLREVRDRRLRVESREHVIAARVLGERRDPRRLVVQVAEHNRLRGAGLGAGRRDVAVLDVAILEARAVLRARDARHTERARL